jgi:hypothetical protein
MRQQKIAEGQLVDGVMIRGPTLVEASANRF